VKVDVSEWGWWFAPSRAILGAANLWGIDPREEFSGEYDVDSAGRHYGRMEFSWYGKTPDHFEQYVLTFRLIEYGWLQVEGVLLMSPRVGGDRRRDPLFSAGMIHLGTTHFMADAAATGRLIRKWLDNVHQSWNQEVPGDVE
jgi:hypothetical protein